MIGTGKAQQREVARRVELGAKGILVMVGVTPLSGMPPRACRRDRLCCGR